MSETETEQPDPETTEPTVPDDDPDQDEGEEEEGTPLEGDIPEGVDPETGEVTDEAALAAAPEAGGGLTEADVEKNTKALNRAADTYIKKVLATLGSDLAGMQTCPLCAESWPGVRFPSMPAPEHLAAVRVAIGLEPGDNLPHDHYSDTCNTCDGWGFVASGSKVPGQTKLTCYDCQGKGWKPIGSEREAGSITAGNGFAVQPNDGPPAISDNTPPEVERLRQMGWVVVEPVQPLETFHG